MSIIKSHEIRKYLAISQRSVDELIPGYCRLVPKRCCCIHKDVPLLIPGLLITIYLYSFQHPAITVDNLRRERFIVPHSGWVLSNVLPHVISGGFFFFLLPLLPLACLLMKINQHLTFGQAALWQYLWLKVVYKSKRSELN